MALVAMASPPLSSLCSICHLKSPKYTCPGCTAHTCSLKCVTTHKKRTSCTGKRDPGIYVPRKDLNHPAVLDRDFNFISGVERGIESADRGAERMGIVKEEVRRTSGPSKGQIPIRKSLKADEVTITKAPAGMARSRSNKTSWRHEQKKPEHKKQGPPGSPAQVKWTVEWCWKFSATTPSGEQKLLSKTFTTQCLEHSTIEAAWAEAQKVRSRLVADDEDHKLSELVRESEAEGHSKDRTRDFEQLKWWRETPARDKYSFYLDAPDLKKPGKEAALIPVPVWTINPTLKDLLKGRTVHEYPTITIWSGCAPAPEQYLVLEPYRPRIKQGKQQATELKALSRKRPASDMLVSEPKVAKVERDQDAEATISVESNQNTEREESDEVQPEGKACEQQEQQMISNSAEDDAISALPVQPRDSGGSAHSCLPSGSTGLIGLDYSSD